MAHKVAQGVWLAFTYNTAFPQLPGDLRPAPLSTRSGTTTAPDDVLVLDDDNKAGGGGGGAHALSESEAKTLKHMNTFSTAILQAQEKGAAAAAARGFKLGTDLTSEASERVFTALPRLLRHMTHLDSAIIKPPGTVGTLWSNPTATSTPGGAVLEFLAGHAGHYDALINLPTAHVILTLLRGTKYHDLLPDDPAEAMSWLTKHWISPVKTVRLPEQL